MRSYGPDGAVSCDGHVVEERALRGNVTAASGNVDHTESLHYKRRFGDVHCHWFGQLLGPLVGAGQ